MPTYPTTSNTPSITDLMINREALNENPTAKILPHNYSNIHDMFQAAFPVPETGQEYSGYYLKWIPGFARKVMSLGQYPEHQDKLQLGLVRLRLLSKVQLNSFIKSTRDTAHTIELEKGNSFKVTYWSELKTVFLFHIYCLEKARRTSPTFYTEIMNSMKYNPNVVVPSVELDKDQEKKYQRFLDVLQV